ncbi:MAG: hypothetical protein IT480_02360 [Gammaproteobacteria bacterium]|nr:hypothetical protein [Gammaproteobacteria bacterium]
MKPVLRDGEEECPRCGCLNTFGAVEPARWWLRIAVALILVALLALLALYAVPEPSPWPVLR